MSNQLESRMAEQVLHVAAGRAVEVVDAQHLVTEVEQALAHVGADEPGPPRSPESVGCPRDLAFVSTGTGTVRRKDPAPIVVVLSSPPGEPANWLGRTSRKAEPLFCG